MFQDSQYFHEDPMVMAVGLQGEADRGVFAQTLAELTSSSGRAADTGTWEMTSQVSEVFPEHHHCVF